MEASEIQAVGSERRENAHTRAATPPGLERAERGADGKGTRAMQDLRLWTPHRHAHLLLPLEMRETASHRQPSQTSHYILLICLLVYFWLCRSVLPCGLFLWLWWAFLLQRLLLWSTSSRARGRQQLWLPGSKHPLRNGGTQA